MICNDLTCACAITSTTLSITGSGATGDPYSINSNAFALCLSSARPSSPALGQFIYETDTGRTLVFNGSNWIWQNGNTPRFQVEQQVVQSIPNNVGTPPVLATEVFDTDAFHTGTNGFVTIPSGWGGDYQFWANTVWATDATSYRHVNLIVTNNTGVAAQNSIRQGGFAMINTANNAVAVSGIYRLRAAAIVTLNVTQATGAALDLSTCSFKGALITHIPTLV